MGGADLSNSGISGADMMNTATEVPNISGAGLSAIKKTFLGLAHRGEKGLITYLTGGDPDLETCRKLIAAMARAGADIIEVGIPFSDPMADGPVIQAASNRALANGVTVNGILEMVKDVRREVAVPIILMTYYNPVLQYGLNGFCSRAASSGVNGLIVPDLPFEENKPLRDCAVFYGLDLVPMVAPTSNPARLEAACKSGQGFVYCVSVTGVTGMRDNIATDIEALSGLVRRHTTLPLAIGFGISGPESAAQMAPFCDAVIVGSALVDLIAQKKYKEVEELTAALKAALSRPHSHGIAGSD